MSIIRIAADDVHIRGLLLFLKYHPICMELIIMCSLSQLTAPLIIINVSEKWETKVKDDVRTTGINSVAEPARLCYVVPTSRRSRFQ